MKELREIAEKSAREYILSKIPSGRISSLGITIDTEGARAHHRECGCGNHPVTLNENCDVKKLADEATKRAFMSIEEYLKKLASGQGL